MPQQYIHNDFNLYPSPHINPHTVPHPAQPLGAYNYDLSSYEHDPFTQFDLAKPMNQFTYMPPLQSQQQQQQQQPQQQLPQQQQQQQQGQYQNHQSAAPALNQFNLSSPYAPQTMYPPSEPKRHRPSTSLSSDDSVPTPNPTQQVSSLRVPKFERTYTDAAEDELYDETSSTASQSAQSQTQVSRHPTPTFNFPGMNHYNNRFYMDKNALGSPAISHAGQVGRQQQQQSKQRQPSQQQPVPPTNGGKSITNVLYPQTDAGYDPLGNRQNAQRLSSTAVADSVRRLQAPNRTTVSPREAFLDYPDSADFRERTLFSKSASPYSQTQDAPGMSREQGSGSSSSHDDEYVGHEDSTLSLQPNTYQMHGTANSLSIPETERSSSSSTGNSAVYSGDVSVESGHSSDSEYDPAGISEKRSSRSNGRPANLSKSFACPECGKRFEKSLQLQTHRRNAHGKGNGPPLLSHNKFSTTSHRCDWVDPVTGKACNTVFSRP
jgi:hypothetical protein